MLSVYERMVFGKIVFVSTFRFATTKHFPLKSFWKFEFLSQIRIFSRELNAKVTQILSPAVTTCLSGTCSSIERFYPTAPNIVIISDSIYVRRMITVRMKRHKRKKLFIIMKGVKCQNGSAWVRSTEKCFTQINK